MAVFGEVEGVAVFPSDRAPSILVVPHIGEALVERGTVSEGVEGSGNGILMFTVLALRGSLNSLKTQQRREEGKRDFLDHV